MLSTSGHSRFLPAVALSLFVLVLLRNAWLGEDAYIGLRTVDNFVHGDGLTWNVNERVQTYTCPLWILLHCIVCFVTREAYYTSIFLSLVLSVLAAAVVWRSARSEAQALFSLLVLVCSKAFMDYSTSGLENPLTHLLLACFLAVYFTQEASLKTLGWLTLLAALAVTNRMDVAVLLAPPVLLVFYRVRGLKAVGVVALASIPFLMWEAFSLFYYGFPFPNTAYAKLGTGIDVWESARQGAYYFRDSLRLDPLTLLVIGSSLLAPFLTRQWRQLPVALGVVLYLLYVVKVGGDFMSGRFFTAPLLVAVCSLGQWDIAPRPVLWGCAQLAVLLFGLLSPGAPLLSGENYHSLRSGFGPEDHGIADERGYYYPFAGLLPVWRHAGEPTHPWVDQGRDARDRRLQVVVKGNIGYFGFYVGREAYVVDPGALTDPLLARLPAVRTPQWRIGHFTRLLPEGYVETLQTGENRLVDKQLAEYQDKLALVVRGPLFDWNRLREIWRLNTGAYDHLIDQEHYRAAPPLVRRYSELPHVQPPEKKTYFGLNGLDIPLEAQPLTEGLEISLDDDDMYDVLFLHGDTERTRRRVEPPEFASVIGLNVYRIDVPYEARHGGCDRLRIVPVPLANDGSFNLGHLRIVESPP